jgi:hypothetical protein
VAESGRHSVEVVTRSDASRLHERKQSKETISPSPKNPPWLRNCAIARAQSMLAKYRKIPIP